MGLEFSGVAYDGVGYQATVGSLLEATERAYPVLFKSLKGALEIQGIPWLFGEWEDHEKSVKITIQ